MGQIRLWDAPKREQIGKDFKAHDDAIGDLCLTPDKKTLVTTDTKGEVKIWNLADLTKPLHTFAAQKEKVVALAMSPDGEHFATAGQENVIKLWDLKTGKELRTWDLKMPTVESPPPGREKRPFVRNCRSPPTANNW